MEQASLYSELSQVRVDIVAPFMSKCKGTNEQSIIDELLALKELNDKLGDEVVKRVVVKLSLEDRHSDILPTLRKMTLDESNISTKIPKAATQENVKFISEDNTRESKELTDECKKMTECAENRNNNNSINKKALMIESKDDKNKHSNFFKSLFTKLSSNKSSKDDIKSVSSDNSKAERKASNVNSETGEAIKTGKDVKQKVTKTTNEISSNQCYRSNLIDANTVNSSQSNPTVNQWQIKQSGRENDVLIPSDGEITAQVMQEEQLLAKEYNFCEQNSSDNYNNNSGKEDGQFYVVYNQFLRQHQQ